MTQVWPSASSAVAEFYSGHLALPQDLWKAFQVTAAGSQRPKGPRNLQWAASLVLGLASLEAGLEDLFLAAHGARAGLTGGQLERDERRYLVEAPLQAPNAQKIEQLLFAHFGARLHTISHIGQFTARHKDSPNTGSGRGSQRPSPTTWADLRDYVKALAHIRNATAHGDVVKRRNPPDGAEGHLWLRKQDGGWSVQQPHALTGLRTVVAVFNSVAHALDQQTGFLGQANPLEPADELFFYR